MGSLNDAARIMSSRAQASVPVLGVGGNHGIRLVSGRPLVRFLSLLLGPPRLPRPLPLRLTIRRGLEGFLVDMSSLYQETRNQRTRNVYGLSRRTYEIVVCA